MATTPPRAQLWVALRKSDSLFVVVVVVWSMLSASDPNHACSD
jgi:hypothetical protein